MRFLSRKSEAERRLTERGEPAWEAPSKVKDDLSRYLYIGFGSEATSLRPALLIH